MKNNNTTENNMNGLIYEVVRTQRKRVSRYKLKKQTVLATKILGDEQIFAA